MSIHFISGKPGGGKSLLATQYIIDELRFGHRDVVTNLALNVGELNAYYQKHYDDPVHLFRWRVPWFLTWLIWLLPDWIAYKVVPVAEESLHGLVLQPRLDDICSRVTLISDDEMSVFFTKRPGCPVEHVSNQDWKAGKRPDYSVVKDRGIYFCLDEVHIAFNSRAWADTGAEVLYYLSQHRKLGDDVVCITQSVANVDKQFRSVAQDFTYVRNLGKERVGLFRLPVRFVKKTYSQPPSGDKSEPMSMGFYSLDVNGIGKCYDTAKGVGIHGRSGADTAERKKGLHWAWFAVGGPVLFYLLVHYGPVALVRFAFPGHRPAPVATHSTAAKAPAANEKQTGPQSTAVSQKQSVEDGEVVTNPPVFCVGWIAVASRYMVFMSDGNVFDSADREVDWIQKRRVSCLGKVYAIEARPAFSDAPPLPGYDIEIPPAVPHPVNDAEVTVIGQRWNTSRAVANPIASRLGSSAFPQSQLNSPLPSPGVP